MISSIFLAFELPTPFTLESESSEAWRIDRRLPNSARSLSERTGPMPGNDSSMSRMLSLSLLFFPPGLRRGGGGELPDFSVISEMSNADVGMSGVWRSPMEPEMISRERYP